MTTINDAIRELLQELRAASEAEAGAYREWEQARKREVQARLAVFSQVEIILSLNSAAGA